MMGFLTQKDEYDYFASFLRCAQLAGVAADYLYTHLQHFEAVQLPQYVKDMHKIENDADSQKHEIMGRLAHEFMTPIEREDIAALSQGIDDIIDAVEDVARRIYMFNVTKLRPEMLTFADLIVQCCGKVETVMAEFRNFKKSKTILPFIIEVNTLESEGDRLHAEAMRRLFTEQTDAKTQLVWMMLFEAMEECLDACETTADIIESIIMKNT